MRTLTETIALVRVDELCEAGRHRPASEIGAETAGVTTMEVFDRSVTDSPLFSVTELAA